MPVVFRNVDARWEDPVVTWPYEALVTTLERGLVSDWQPVLHEMKANPWGKTARRVEKYLSYQQLAGLNLFFAAALQRARDTAETRERDEVALRGPRGHCALGAHRSGVCQEHWHLSLEAQYVCLGASCSLGVDACSD